MCVDPTLSMLPLETRPALARSARPVVQGIEPFGLASKTPQARLIRGGVFLHTRTLSLLVGFLTVFVSLAWSSHSDAGRTYRILVFKENGIGSASSAQPYVDKLVALAAKANQWSAGEGKYVTRRSRAKDYIDDKKPEFGILSLGPFLAFRSPHSLEVVGVAEVARAGGRQYHLVSKSASSLAGCKGKKVASNHADD